MSAQAQVVPETMRAFVPPNPPRSTSGMTNSLNSSFRVDEIVLAASELPTSDRLRYLNQLASAHPELMPQVHRWLSAASRVSDSFLALPAAELLAEPERIVAEDSPPVSPEARYQLQDRIGAGGMAEVFRAYDVQLDRPVALKSLHLADTGHQQSVLHEARCQARVRHAHVLEVYETGIRDGSPFITMRYVDGGTLGQLLGQVSLETMVDLFRQVAEGLHAAHVIGLVHRDVKPSNVLVEATNNGGWHAWVTDFGLAWDKGDGVHDGVLAGTPSYLAPELLRRPNSVEHPVTDRRCDIYSLGVTMFQQLAGHLPFQDSELPALLGTIRDAPAPALRSVVPSSPVELEAIVLKCMAKDPADRYATAADLASDLRRFLAGDLVHAYAASTPYRLTRLVSRYRLLAGVVGVSAVLLLVALIIVTMLSVQTAQANLRAQRRQLQAENLIDFMLVDLRKKLTSVGRLKILDDVGDAAMDYFSAVPVDELSDGELTQRSRALYQIGEVRMQQGDLQGARPPFTDSLALARAITARHPNDEERLFDLGQSLFWVGYVDLEQRNWAMAQKYLHEYLEISQRLVAGAPDNTAWQRELGYAYSNLGTLAERQSRFLVAEKHYRKSLRIEEGLLKKTPSDSALKLDVAEAHNLLGHVMELSGQPGAHHHFETELGIREKLLKAQPNNLHGKWRLAVVHCYLGNWWLEHGATTTSLAHFEETTKITEALVAHDTRNHDWAWTLARALLGRARARGDLGQKTAALRDYDRHLHQLDAMLREQAVRTWFLHRQLGAIYRASALMKAGRLKAAEKDLSMALSALESDAPSDDFDARTKLAHGYLVRAELLEAQGEEARAQWQRAVDVIAPFALEQQKRDAVVIWVRGQQALNRDLRSEAAALDYLRKSGFCSPEFRILCASD